MFLPSIILEIFTISQIPNNFHTNLGKTELLTTFDRKMILT